MSNVVVMHIHIPLVSVSSLMCSMMSCGFMPLSDDEKCFDKIWHSALFLQIMGYNPNLSLDVFI